MGSRPSARRWPGRGRDLPPGRALILAGKTLVSTVGGASGPLWGSALRAAGRVRSATPRRSTASSSPTRSTPRSAPWSTSAPRRRATRRWSTRSARRDAALRERLANGGSIADATEAAAAAAERGGAATVPMQARKGRASYLGERSVGHQDPGATSAALIMRALHEAVVAEA